MIIFFNPPVLEGAVDSRADVVSRRYRVESLEFSGTREEGTGGRSIYPEKEGLSMWNGAAGDEEYSVCQRSGNPVDH